MAESCCFDRERDVNKQRGNVSYDENDGTERLANFNWCSCSRCELREIAREYICCLQQPESESKFARGKRTLIGLQLCMQVYAVSRRLFILQIIVS